MLHTVNLEINILQLMAATKRKHIVHYQRKHSTGSSYKIFQHENFSYKNFLMHSPDLWCINCFSAINLMEAYCCLDMTVGLTQSTCTCNIPMSISQCTYKYLQIPRPACLKMLTALSQYCYPQQTMDEHASIVPLSAAASLQLQKISLQVSRTPIETPIPEQQWKLSQPKKITLLCNCILT